MLMTILIVQKVVVVPERGPLVQTVILGIIARSISERIVELLRPRGIARSTTAATAQLSPSALEKPHGHVL
jgi:galactitol-specific phosphotransferase system IIC component